jgi:hypothetical protein
MLGLRVGLRNKCIDEVRKKIPDVALLSEVLRDEKLQDVHFNIEVKSTHGVDCLVELLKELKSERDLSTIMVSSPIWPEIQLKIAADKELNDVALAAPFIHGGVLGVRFRGRKRAVIRENKEQYACQQCWSPFTVFRSVAPTPDRPLRQLWTIGTRRRLHRGAEKQAHMIVHSARIALPHRDTGRIDCKPLPKHPPTMLALGGGGWRGGFGGIGTVLYFAHRAHPSQKPGENMWQPIREVVGISGGAFVVAALSAQPDAPDPVPIVTDVLGKLVRAGRRISYMVFVGLALAAPIVAGVAFSLWYAWTHHWWGAVLGIVLLVLVLGTFLLRSFLTVYWKMVLRGLYKSTTMHDIGGIDRQGLGRRYQIGATGMHDGNLYSYTTHLAGDRLRWLANKSLPTPVPDVDKHGKRHPHKLWEAVLRATSLPGLRQVGHRRIYLCDHGAKGGHVGECWVPDRLVDGGLSGIFGRGLIQARRKKYVDQLRKLGMKLALGQGDDAPHSVRSRQHKVVRPHAAPTGDAQLVIVDAGRALTIRTGRTVRDRFLNSCEGISSLAMLARWFQIALEVAYREELERVKDGKQFDEYSCRLIRLAEEERHDLSEDQVRLVQRQLELNRLALLRDRVHAFSLGRCRPLWANRAMTVAVAACELEFAKDEDVEVEKILKTIGKTLTANGYKGDAGALADIWRKVPVLGWPVADKRKTVPVLGWPAETIAAGFVVGELA